MARNYKEQIKAIEKAMREKGFRKFDLRSSGKTLRDFDRYFAGMVGIVYETFGVDPSDTIKVFEDTLKNDPDRPVTLRFFDYRSWDFALTRGIRQVMHERNYDDVEIVADNPEKGLYTVEISGPLAKVYRIVFDAHLLEWKKAKRWWSQKKGYVPFWLR